MNSSYVQYPVCQFASPGYKDACTWRGQEWAWCWLDRVSGSEQISAEKQESGCHIKMSPDRTDRLPLLAEYVLISVHNKCFLWHACTVSLTHLFFFSIWKQSQSLFFPRGITDSWQTGCTHSCSLALERDSEGNTFLKSTYSSLSLRSFGYLDFNDALFGFLYSVNFQQIPCSTPGVLTYVKQKFVTSQTHIYCTLLWEVETPGFSFLGTCPSDELQQIILESLSPSVKFGSVDK